MRVLTVIPGDGRGPAYVWARRQKESLERAGIEVRPFYLSSRTSPERLGSEWRRYQAVLHEFDPNVVLGHYGAMTGFFCAYGTRRPVVITFHGSDLNPCPSVNRLRLGVGHGLSQLAAQRARRIICVSRQLLGRLRWGRERATVIPMGVDVHRFSPRPRREARDLLHWGHDEPVVLFNAGLDPAVKRLDLAEAAFAIARTRVPDLRLHVMRGDVDPDDVPLHMAAADALLLTSDYEGSPMVIKEAVSSGLPIVSVDVGDVRERLESVSPSRITAREPEALAAGVLELLADGRRSDGPAVAVRDFSEERVTERVIEVLSQAAG
jgi:glycosyltransferase involved in cell wall biosynthesis